MRAYRCKERGCGYWHLGELPREVVAGNLTVGEFYQTGTYPRPEPGRSATAQIRRWRRNAAVAVEKDMLALAEGWADRQVADRRNDAWAIARREAAAVLEAIPDLLRELAGPAHEQE